MTAGQDSQRMQLAAAEVCMQLSVPFFWQGAGTMLIAGSGLAAVLRELAARGHRVIGLEGFDMITPDIHPRLDLIYDADRAKVPDASAFSAGWPADVWVDIMLDSAAVGSQE
jgi:hypothetical protein